MSTTLHWAVKGALRDLFEKNRWNILTIYITHSNIRGRAWPGQAYIYEAFGIDPHVTGAALKWLIEAGALVLVPRSAYFGNEKNLPPASRVYELTGKLIVNGKSYPYLFSGNPAEWNAAADSGPLFVNNGNSPILEKINIGDSPIKDDSTKSLKVNPNYGDCFVAILEAGWNETSKTAVSATKRRCGEVTKALLKNFPDVTPDEIRAFYSDWERDNKGADKPIGELKLPDNFSKWRKTRAITPARTEGLVPHPDDPARLITLAQRDQILAVRRD